MRKRLTVARHVLGSVICLKVTPCKQAAVSDQETMSYDAFSKAYQQKNHMEAEGSGLSLTRAALPDLLRTLPPHHRPHHTLTWTVSLAQGLLSPPFLLLLLIHLLPTSPSHPPPHVGRDAGLGGRGSPQFTEISPSQVLAVDAESPARSLLCRTSVHEPSRILRLLRW
ncbi:hypothetical protein Pmani_026010 [Petrolisthes manimaculis]|uniref:Uncharacterized protein n=1 Tax=Petrolisthes manimaculis TaxID=1843537 RepID=A0AAE1P741_9EUCA|nr:hypothetical protein Pmani_026010 [Petrolisthes manimaculis]